MNKVFIVIVFILTIASLSACKSSHSCVSVDAPDEIYQQQTAEAMKGKTT